MRIVFMGTPDFAVATLKELNEGEHEIVGVVTVADKPAGRGKKLRPSPVKVYAEEHGLHLMQPTNLKDEEFVGELRSLNADLFVVVAFRMLPEVVWSMPPKGTINLHGSLLPNYRGAAPINWAIMNGDQKSGVTTFFIEKEIDTGKIIDSAELDISENMTAGEMHDELMHIGAGLTASTVNNIALDQVVAKPQAEFDLTHIKEAPKIFKDTCRIDWTKSNGDIHNHIRGLSPYPAAWTMLMKEEEETSLKIFRTEKNDGKLSPGEIKTDNKSFLEIGCGTGSLLVTELQLSGKKRMDIKSFLNGVKLENQHCK